MNEKMSSEAVLRWREARQEYPVVMAVITRSACRFEGMATAKYLWWQGKGLTCIIWPILC